METITNVSHRICLEIVTGNYILSIWHVFVFPHFLFLIQFILNLVRKSADIPEPGHSDIYSKCQLWPLLSRIIPDFANLFLHELKKIKKEGKMIFCWTFRNVFRMSTPPCGSVQTLLLSLHTNWKQQKGQALQHFKPFIMISFGGFRWLWILQLLIVIIHL